MRFKTRAVAFLATAALIAPGLAACSSGSGGGATLTWFINPNGGGSSATGGGQAQLATECSAASGGEYIIRVEQLPNDASDQRRQLIRRLAAHGTGVDIMSLDPVVVSEFAEANYLVDVPGQYTQDFTADRVKGLLDASRWKDKLVATPFWANTQLLWYRKSVAQQAGLDMTQPIIFDQLMNAAKTTGKDIAVQGKRYEGYTILVNVLVSGAGGKIVENKGAAATDAKLGFDIPAGQRIAALVSELSHSGVVGPAMSSMDETMSLNMFQAEDSSGFMLDRPYVYAAMEANGVSFVDDIAWITCPRVNADKKSALPSGGTELGVNAASQKQDLAWKAIKCITSEQHQRDYMLGTGNPASRAAVFDNAEIREQFLMVDAIRESLNAAVQQPRTAYYGDLSTAVQRTWLPPDSVDPATTPRQSTDLIIKVLKGEALLWASQVPAGYTYRIAPGRSIGSVGNSPVPPS